jgi:hypothetical protein
MDEEALRSAAENYKAASEEVTGDNEQSGEESEPAAEDYEANADVTEDENSEESDSQPAEDGGDQSEAFVCEFAATYNQRRDALQNALDSNSVTDSTGEVIESTHYWVSDFDDEYAYVNRYIWRKNGDCTDDHGRFGYSFNDADLTASITGDFEPMYLMWLTEDERQKLENARSVFEELKAYKAEHEKAERKVAVDELFEQFEDLSEVAGFGDLRNAAYEGGEMAEIEEKLYALRGRQVKNFAKSAPVKTTMRVGIAPATEDAEEVDVYYGGILKKH